MHFADPRGHLLVNGQAPSDRQLATMAGLTVREVRTARDELVRSGAASLDGDVLFSRRMVRDTERASLTAARVRDHRFRNADVTQDVTLDVTPLVTPQKRSTRARSQSTRDPEIQKSLSPPTPRGGVGDPLEAEFQAFYAAYPKSRRVSGHKGREAFRVARRSCDLATMLTALEQHKRSEQWQTPSLIALMTTWLNQERWGQVLPESGNGMSVRTQKLAASDDF